VTNLVVIPLSRLPHVPIPETQEAYSLWLEDDERVVVFVCEELDEAA
jgi:hypothetical protein